MKSTDDLFQLIHSLTRSEKRYFKLYASRQAGEYQADYLHLFDVLDGMKEYDEAELRAKLKSDVLKYLPQTKYYLYKTVLKALNQYNLQSSVEAQLNEMIESSKALLAKKLPDQCRKLLAKAEKLAVSRDAEYHLAQIMTLRYRAAIIGTGSGDVEQEVDEIFHALVNITSRLAERHPVWRVQALMFLANVNARHDSLQRSSMLLDDLASINEQEIIDPVTRIMYYTIQDSYYDIRQDFEQVCSIRRRIVEYMESTPILMHRPLDRYVPMLYNYCQVLIQTERLDEFRTQYAKLLRTVEEGRIHSPSYNDILIRMLEPRFHFQAGDYSTARTLMVRLEKDFHATRSTMRLGVVPYYRYLHAVLCFIEGDLKNTLKWLNEILNDRGEETHEQFHRHAWLLNLMVHHELGNIDAIDSYSASAERFLHRHGALTDFEKFAINIVRRAGTAGSRSEIRKLLDESRKQLTDLQQNERMPPIIGLGEWLEAKAQGVSLAAHLRTLSPFQQQRNS